MHRTPITVRFFTIVILVALASAATPAFAKDAPPPPAATTPAAATAPATATVPAATTATAPATAATRQAIIEQEQAYSCNLLFDIIHLQGAEAVASYGKDFYAGIPVVTKNTFGEGAAWYIGSNPEEGYLSKLLKNICHDAGIEPIMPASEGIEVSRRVKEESQYTFILNHNDLPEKLVLEQSYRNLLTNKEYANGEEIVLSPKDVLVLENL